MKIIPAPYVFEKVIINKLVSREHLSWPLERATASFAMAHKTSIAPDLIFSLTTLLWLVMSRCLHREGSLAAASHGRHTSPAPIRISMGPSLAKTDVRTSRGSQGLFYR
jgi:hypothetical protein